MLAVHRVDCFCTAGHRTTTTIYRDGRAATRIRGVGGLEPIRFQLDDEEMSEIDDAFAQVDFMSLPARVERGDGASAVSDARRIKVTHDGHTVRERTFFPAAEDPYDLPRNPLPFVLAPVDDLIEGHIESSVRPRLARALAEEAIRAQS